MKLLVLMVSLLSVSFVTAAAAQNSGAAPVKAPAAANSQPAISQPTIAQNIADSKTRMDINTATAAQLKTLPGMGDAYVARIIGGRPYTAKNQLVQRGILPQAVYDGIKDQIIAHRPKS